MDKYLEELEVNGHCLLHSVLSDEELRDSRNQTQRVLDEGRQGVLQSRDQGYGVRNLLDLWPEVVELTRNATASVLIRQVMGADAGVVRCLFFDKPPGRSWTLPWHRDRTIAIANPVSEMKTFSNLTKKAGVYHVNAPPEFLRHMLTLRFSLDPMLDENGPLVVQSGKHWPIEDGNEESQVQAEPFTKIFGQAGDMFVMRPLLPHSSLKSAESTQLRRRIIHIELSNIRHLPEGLEWHRFEPVFRDTNAVG